MAWTQRILLYISRQNKIPIMKILLLVCIGFLVLFFTAVPASAWDTVGKKTEWEGDPEMRPHDIATLSDGSAWMTHEEAGNGALITLDYGSGYLVTYPAPESAHFLTIDNAPDDTLWIADSTGKLWHFRPATHTFFSYDPPGDWPSPDFYGVSVAPDGRVWLTSQSSANPYIAVFEPYTSWTRYDIDTSGTFPPGIPVEIDFETDGTVWFTIKKTESSSRYGGVGFLDPDSGAMMIRTGPAIFSVPGGLINPWGIVVDDHDPNRVWFVDKTASVLVRYTISPPQASWYDLDPAGFLDSHFIAMDPDGKIWLASYGPNRIGVFDPDTGTISSQFDPGTVTNPIGITISDLGEVWWPGSGRDGETGMGRFIPFKDSDHDGIDDRIDKKPHTSSTKFYDAETNTRGTIRSGGGRKLTVTKAATPYGVRIMASPRLGRHGARIVFTCPEALGGRRTIRITRNDDCIVTCGEPVLVLRGTVGGAGI